MESERVYGQRLFSALDRDRILGRREDNDDRAGTGNCGSGLGESDAKHSQQSEEEDFFHVGMIYIRTVD